MESENSSGPGPTSGMTTLVVQDPSDTLRELTDLDRDIQNKDEEIVQRKAALKKVQEEREEMVALLRAKIRSANNPMPLMPLFDAGSSTDEGADSSHPPAA